MDVVIHNNSSEPVDVFIVDGKEPVPAVCIDGNGDEVVFERVREAFEHANRNHGEAGITEIHFTLSDGTELEFVEVKGNEWGYQGWDLKPLKGILIKKDVDEDQTDDQMG